MGSGAQGSSSRDHYVCNSHTHKNVHTGTLSTSTAAIHMLAFTQN